jgi:hypothetical protein
VAWWDTTVRVAWTGTPLGPGQSSPAYFTQKDEADAAFAPQRNVAGPTADARAVTVAADLDWIWVFWHAGDPKENAPANRRVWMAKSTDNGKTFPETRPISPAGLGICPNCGLCALCTYPHMPAVLCRAATDSEHRDTYLLHLEVGKPWNVEGGKPIDPFATVKVQQWKTTACPATSAALADVGNDYLAAWETAGQIYYCRIPHNTGKVGPFVAAPGKGGNRKHPALAHSGSRTVLVWLEAASKDTSVCWQIFSHDDRPTHEQGEFTGIPPGSHAAVISDGQRFFVVY